MVAGPAFGAWRQARGSRHLARWRAGSALGGALSRSRGRRELRRKRARVPISGGSRTGMDFPRQAAALDLQPLRYLAGEAGAVRKGRDTGRTHQRSRPPHLRGRRPGVALHPALSGRPWSVSDATNGPSATSFAITPTPGTASSHPTYRPPPEPIITVEISKATPPPTKIPGGACCACSMDVYAVAAFARGSRYANEM